MTRRLRLAGLPLAALLLAGCGGGGTDSSNLPLRLTVEPTGTVKPGDTLRMTAYLRAAAGSRRGTGSPAWESPARCG